MSLLKPLSLLLLSIAAYAYCLGSTTTPPAPQQQEVVLPEMPFKKSLLLTSILLYNSPHKDVELVEKLTNKLAQYEVLESQAEVVVAPLRASRKALKQTVVSITFKDEQDLLKVADQIKKETDEIVSHNIDELQRDKLIKFNKDVEVVFGSKQYEAILKAAKQYQAQQFELQRHPLFGKMETVRKELKPLMYTFLKQNYSTVKQLQKAFNEPVNNVNTFLNAME